MSLIYQAPAFGGGGPRSGIYLGGKADAKDKDKLMNQWNVTHILNVTPPKQAGIQAGVPNYFESSGAFTYKRIAVLDASTSATDLAEHAEEIASFIASGLCHGSVLVHCQRGISRSTTAVLIYLMRRVGMPLEDAVALVRRRRPKAQPIPAFVEILERYEQGCRKQGSIKSTADTATSASVKSPPGPALPTKHAKRPRPIGPAIGPAAGPTENEKPDKLSKIIGPERPPQGSLDATEQFVGPSLRPQLPVPSGASSEEKKLTAAPP